MDKKKLTYTEAMKRLEDIVGRIERGEEDLDHLPESLREAGELIRFCRDKLFKAESEVADLLPKDEE